MKERHDRFSVVGFVLVIAFLTGIAVGQNPAKPQPVTNPVTVEIANQPDSPMLISLVSVDTTDERFQKINITLQNLGEKPIRGYVLKTGKIETNFFPTKPFVKGRVKDGQTLIETENIRSNDFKVTIFVDYVAYTDGTGWGDDKEQMSESIEGQICGTRSAFSEISALMKGAERTSIENTLSKPLADIDLPMPAGSENQSDKWQRGYRTGYRSFFYSVKSRYTEPTFLDLLENVSKQLSNCHSFP